MVATIRKLSVKKVKSGTLSKSEIDAIVRYFVGNTSERYYTQGGEPPGQWFGAGAHQMGLNGTVTSEQLRNLLMGRCPDGKKRLVQIQVNRKAKQQSPSTTTVPRNKTGESTTPGPKQDEATEVLHAIVEPGSLIESYPETTKENGTPRSEAGSKDEAIAIETVADQNLSEAGSQEAAIAIGIGVDQTDLHLATANIQSFEPADSTELTTTATSVLSNSGLALPATSTTDPSNPIIAEVKKGQERDDHVSGFDITFSAPKSVSVLWALSPPEIRSKIELAVRRAVESTLRMMEETLPLIRRGKGGEKWETGKIAAALFEHGTARNEGDPQLHIHALILNILHAEDGRTFKLNSQVLYEFTRTAGPLFRNNLASELVESLAVQLELAKDAQGKDKGWFEIKDVQKELIELFSTRSEELRNETDLLGTIHSDAKAREQANLRTRHSKGEQLPREKQFEKWANQAIEIGIRPESLQSVLGKPPKKIDTTDRFEKAFAGAVDKLISSDATFKRHHLIREVSERMQDVPVRAEKLLQAIDHSLAHSKEVEVVGTHKNQTYLTTKKMKALEQENVDMVKKLASTPGLAVSYESLLLGLAVNPKLSEEQFQVAREVASKQGSLAVIGGVAGSGKSTVMKALADIYAHEGRRFIGVSVAGAAAQNLQEKTGAECTSIERLLYHQEKSATKRAKEVVTEVAKVVVDAVRYKKNRQIEPRPYINKNTVLIVDEIGMLDTPQGHRLLKQVVAVGAKIIAVGDHEQLPPIGAGNVLGIMVEQVGQSFLQKNWRQTEIEANASQLFRDGKIAEALQIYAEKGDLKVSENRTIAAREMVKAWSQDRHKEHPDRAKIFVQTREEVRIINRMCQQERLLSGDMKSRHTKVGTEKIHEGEWIKLTASDRRKGIENSNTGFVTKIARNGDVHITLDREFTNVEKRRGMKKEVIISAKELKKHKGKDGLIVPAYATTVHGGQGLSVDYCYFMPGGRMTNKNLSYVGISRSKVQTKIFIDQDHAGPYLSLIEEAMKKHVEKATAHEISQRLRIERS